MACYEYKGVKYTEEDLVKLLQSQQLKTRRILELQSDLFQKGRDEKKALAWNRYILDNKGDVIGENPNFQSEQDFLNLLRKDNNWVTFFVKSIIQDSAKKGYEKVLFPSGNTASKVEGHTTLEEFKKQKENRIKKLEKQRLALEDEAENNTAVDSDGGEYDYTEEFENIDTEIYQLKQELKRIEEEGFGALLPIFKFYEETVTNVLKKQGYNPTQITDEYGNTWNEVEINELANNTILFQKQGIKQSKASAKTIAKVKEFLKRIGVDIQALDTERYGGINGVANFLEGFIQLAEGKEDVAITEEAMHFLVEILELTNPTLFKQMMNKIGKYNVFSKVMKLYSQDSEYQTDGKPDILKLKKEAIGKLLAEYYIQSEDGQSEAPDLMIQTKSWWEQIIDAIKKFLKIADFNPFQEALDSFNDLNNTNSPTKILAKRILDSLSDDNMFKKAIKDTYDNGDYKAVVTTFYQQLTDKSVFGMSPYESTVKMLGGNEELAKDIISLGNPFYQLSEEKRKKQQEIANSFDQKLKDFEIRKVTGKAEFEEQDDINYYERKRDGKIGKVAKRVTDFVKETKRPDVLAKFENASAKEKNTYKQKAEYGTAFHNDAESIIKASLTSDGYLKPIDQINVDAITPNLPQAGFLALKNYLVGEIDNEGNIIPGILYTQFPTGTLFKVEQIIYDEKRDVAGTIDLMGITPEGKIMIYDWKTKFLDTKKFDDVPFYSQADYRIQLAQYKAMMYRYGLKPKEDVIVAQAIPIVYKGKIDSLNGDVTLTDIIFPEIDIKQETRRYLLPVPIAEQSSGNTKVDQYIDALNQLYQVLYKQKDVNKELKNEQLNAISGAIRELQVKQEFGPLAEQGLIFLKSAERVIEDINTQLKNEDGTYKEIDPKQVDEYSKKLKLINDNIHKYQSTYQLFDELYGDKNLTEYQQETYNKLERLSLDSGKIASKINTEYINFVKQYYTSKEGLDILKTEKPIQGLLDRSIQSLSRMQNVALQYLRSVTARANFQKQRDAIKRQEELRKLLDAFKKTAQARGLSPTKYFTLLVSKNKKGDPMNQLIKKIKTEFYTEFEKATKDEPDINWIKQNIDLDKYIEDKEKVIQKMFDQIDASIYSSNSKEDAKRKEEKKEDIIKMYSFDTPNALGWYRQDLKYYIKDESKWETDEYKQMSKDKSILDLYDFIIKLNKEAKDMGYHDDKTSLRFLPWMRASMLDRIRTSGLSAIGDSMEYLYKLTPEEEISYSKVDPNTGTIEKSIPAFFTKNFAPEIRDADGNIEGYDLSDVSTDLGETLPMYIEALYEFKSLSDIEQSVKAVRDVEAAKKAFLLDEKGRIVKEKGTNINKLANDNEANVKLYDSFVEAILYKRTYDSTANLSTGATKTIEKMNQYFRLKVFGLNIFTPITTFIGGNLQALINSRKLWRGQQFLKNEMKIVGNLFKGEEGNIEKGLIDYFIPFTENRAKLNAERMSFEKIQRFSFSDFIMAPIRKTDIMVQMATSLTMLENTVLIDGELVNAREYILNSKEYRDRYKDSSQLKSLEKDFEKKVKELVDSKGVMKFAKFNKDGLLEIEGVSRDSDTVNRLRLRMLDEIKNLTGNLTEEDKRDADRNILLKSMMMFKNWIPRLAAVRFGDLQKNIDANQYEMGRVRMVYQVIKNGDGGWIKGLTNGIRDLRNMVAGNEEGLKVLAKYYERTAESYKNKTGNDLEMTPEEFYDMTRRAIEQTAKDAALLATFMTMFIYAKSTPPDDDDSDENKNFYKISVRMLDKLTDEISFYYNPLSLQQISTGSWMPSIGILTDGIKFSGSLIKEVGGRTFGVEKWEETAHPTKNFLNMIPIANQFFKTFIPVINPDIAKDLDIRVSTESRRN